MDALSPSTIYELKALYPAPAESLRLHPGSYATALLSFKPTTPKAVVSIYKAVLEDLRADGNDDVNFDDHVTLVSKLQETLLKASLFNGIPRAVTTMSLLNSAVPKSVLEKFSSPLRDFTRPFSDMALHSHQFLSDFFGDDIAKGPAQDLLNSCSPDIGILTTGSYALVLGHSTVLSSIETSCILIAASILNDFPREVCWFYRAAMEQGATIGEIQAIRDMALKVASLSGVTLREKVPEVVAKDLIQVY
ncbi:hypothetical protein ONZ45_g6321 [Pleurotus djamor]|nr:hypothetical protein ONZ45_g6321 [Pleurotus djamor]